MTSNLYTILYPPVRPAVTETTKDLSADGDHDTDRHGGHDTQRHDEVAIEGEIMPPLMTSSVTPLMTLGDAPHDTQCRNNKPTRTSPLNKPFAEASALSAPPPGKVSEFFARHGAIEGMSDDETQAAFEDLHVSLTSRGMKPANATELIDHLSKFYVPRVGGMAIIRREAGKRVDEAANARRRR